MEMMLRRRRGYMTHPPRVMRVVVVLRSVCIGGMIGGGRGFSVFS